MSTPRTDAVYPPEIIAEQFKEQGRNWGWGTLHDMRECSVKLETELAAVTKKLELCMAANSDVRRIALERDAFEMQLAAERAKVEKLRDAPRKYATCACAEGSEMRNQIAIDPGASGGFAWYDEEAGASCIAMPETEGDVLAVIRQLAWNRKDPVAYVEEVGGYVGGGGQPGSAMFTFGRGFGFILGCLMACGFRIELVRPQKWQKSLSIGTSKDCGGENDKPAKKKALWKKKLKAKAQQLFPTCNVTLKTCDALLLLNYSNQQNQ